MQLKWDGHTHTEYCPHGEVQDVEELVRKAISLGFNRYSITEHAPLPPAMSEKFGGEPIVWETGAMALNDVDHYFKKVEKLKKKYASEIDLRIGFEVDYFDDCHDWTTDFLNEYGPLTTDGLISVHFLSGVDGVRCIDFTAEDFREGVVAKEGSFQKAQESYYQMVLHSLEADLGAYKPKRLGHISLCQKFQKKFADEDITFSENSLLLIDEILAKVKERNYSLDLNTAGLYKPDCLETYPPTWLIEKALSMNIPFVYGSDSHSIDDVGRSYDKIAQYVER